MTLIESDDMQCAVDMLKGWKWSVDDFELNEVDMTGRARYEPAPIPGSVQIRRKSNGITRKYLTGCGSAWVVAFQRDLFCGQFS